jgi:hypothetical protein
MKLKLENPEHVEQLRSHPARHFASEPGLAEPRVFGSIARNKYGGYSVHYYTRAIVPEEFHSVTEAENYVMTELGEVIEATGRLLGESE